MPTTEQSLLRLVEVAAPFWAGEAEIVRTYLDGPRTIASDLRWLYAQAYKEAFVYLSLPPTVRRHFRESGQVLDPGGDGTAAARVVVELAHFRLLAEIIAALWAPVRMEDLVQLPADRNMQRLRATLADAHGALGRAVVAFTEGGGGAMYAVLSTLDGGPIDRRIGAAFAIIHRDEMLHGPAQVHAIAPHAAAAGDWDLAADLIRAISAQRLLMRNEMFGHPVSASRLEAIARGEIEPWPIPREVVASAAARG